MEQILAEQDGAFTHLKQVMKQSNLEMEKQMLKKQETQKQTRGTLDMSQRQSFANYADALPKEQSEKELTVVIDDTVSSKTLAALEAKERERQQLKKGLQTNNKFALISQEEA